MKYGMENIEQNGAIEIDYEMRADAFEIIITEKGVTMIDRMVDKLNTQLKIVRGEGEYTSTRNIERRIKLFYGEQYGIRYEKTPNGDFRTIVSIDGRKKDESMENNGGR
jgi:two-component system sensor histidine kinase YesM